MKLTTKKRGQTLPFSSKDQAPDHLAAIERILNRFPPLNEAVETMPLLDLFFSDQSILSLYLLSFDHVETSKFFYEMAVRYLLPTKALGLVRVFLAPFRCSYSHRSLLVGEVAFCIEKEANRAEVMRRFDHLKGEILFGLRSPYYASRMLELKALSLDEKHALVQDRLAARVRRFSSWYGFDLFSWMQRFFLATHSDYLRMHEVRQVAKTIASCYLIEKELFSRLDPEKNRRHVSLKVSHSRCHFPFGIKQVIGITLGLNFLRDCEVFKRLHLIKAVEAVTQKLELLDSTFFLYRAIDQPLEVIYAEFALKEGGSPPDVKKLIARLRSQLCLRIKERVEQRHHPLFMPRNEEEVMRHIVTLGKELRFLRDLPQVIISFDKQSDQLLFFTVIIARILLHKVPTTCELASALSDLKPNIERVKVIGQLRKKYTKEAMVIKVELLAEDFLRDDQSIDLYRARRAVLSHLEGALGAVRDYNGGMIAKQNEVFRDLAMRTRKNGREHQLLLENFFHSLYPSERRACLEPKELACWFSLLVKAVLTPCVDGQSRSFLREKGKTLAVIIECVNANVKERVSALTGQIEGVIPELISFQLCWDERHFLGYLFATKERGKRTHFKEALSHILGMYQ